MVELGHVAEALNAHTRRIDMMTEHHRQMYETDRQQRDAMNIENRRAIGPSAGRNNESVWPLRCSACTSIGKRSPEIGSSL